MSRQKKGEMHGSNLKKIWLPQSPKTAPYKGTESPLFHSVKNLKAGLWPSLTITSVGGGDTSRGWERETFTSRRRGTETLLRGSLWLSCYYWSAECWTFLNLALMPRQNFFGNACSLETCSPQVIKTMRWRIPRISAVLGGSCPLRSDVCVEWISLLTL